MLLTNTVRIGIIIAFAWVAWRDYHTQTVPNETWRPLLTVGIVLLLGDVATGRAYPLFMAGFGVTMMALISSLFQRLGTWGGADTQAYIVIAVLFPVPPLGVPVAFPFVISVFMNSILLSGVYLIGKAIHGRQVPTTIPFLVPTFVGIVLTVVVGDLIKIAFV